MTSPNPNGLGIQNAAATTNPDSSGTLTPNPDRDVAWNGTLSAALAPTVDSITAGASPAGGYLPSASSGSADRRHGRRVDANFNVPAFLWGDEEYTRVGITSNGYIVVGGGVGSDVEFVPQTMPDVARPNNAIAPWWTDIDLSQAASANTGARIEILTDGVDDWLGSTTRMSRRSGAAPRGRATPMTSRSGSACSGTGIRSRTSRWRTAIWRRLVRRPECRRREPRWDERRQHVAVALGQHGLDDQHVAAHARLRPDHVRRWGRRRACTSSRRG